MAFLTQVVVVIFALVICWILTNQRPDIQVTKQPCEEYDYIVVGAGSAGAVVATRLSEDPDVTVLLVEAGPADYPNAEVPSAIGELQQTNVSWKRRTEPQKYCCQARNNRVSYWPTGKILGGSSMLNFMAYIRGSRHDYDAWEEMGCEGWGYDDVLPYFIKQEDNKNTDYLKSGYHGGSGPVKVTELKSTSLSDVFVKASVELGESEQDINGESQIGVMHMQGNIYNGIRQSTAETYLRSNSHRENLHIIVNSHVTKILFENKKTVGIEYINEGIIKTIRNRRDIIISAGGVGSPHLLLLSGIGPIKHLQEHNIPVIADLPVGHNLQDHIYTYAAHFLMDAPISITEEKMNSIWNKLQYSVYGTGIKASSGAEGVLFRRSKFQPVEDKFPYLQFQLYTINPGSSKNAMNSFKTDTNSKNEVFKALFGDQIGQEGFAIIPILLHPMTQGNITLQNTDPLKQPVITMNYLEDQRDVDIFVEGIKFLKTMEETEAFKSVGARMSRQLHPYCKNHTWGSDEYWRCYVTNDVLTLFHPSCTCKMGAEEDPTAVVDSRLRVKDVKGLRVADASIMPFVVSGNTNAPCMMIGEKAASIIKQDYRNK